MTKFAGTIAIAAFALGLFAAPAFAGSNLPSPAGSWESTTGEARYEIEMCGDGTQVCATLTWLRADVQTPENMAYLNKVVVNGARQAGPVKWKGDVTYEGETYAGALTLVSGNALRLVGCKAIACESMVLNRL